MDGGRNDSNIWDIRHNIETNLQNMVVLNSSIKGLSNLVPSTYSNLHQATGVGHPLKRKADHLSNETKSKIVCQSLSQANNLLVNHNDKMSGMVNGNVNINHNSHTIKTLLPQSQPGLITQSYRLPNSSNSLTTPQLYKNNNAHQNQNIINFLPNQNLNKSSSYSSNPSNRNLTNVGMPNQYILIQTSIGPTLIPISQVKNKVFLNNNHVNSNVEIKKYQNNALQNLSVLASLQAQSQPNRNEVLKCSNNFLSQQNLLPQIKLLSTTTSKPTNAHVFTNNGAPRHYESDIKSLHIVNDNSKTLKPIANYPTSNHVPILGQDNIQSSFPNNVYLSQKVSQVNVSQDRNLIKVNSYSKQLLEDYKILSNPNFNQCCIQDGICMLLPYHVYYTEEPMLPDSNETILCDLFKRLEHNKSTLFHKYRKLYLDNTTKDNNTLENILIDRLWLSLEKETLAHERLICATQGPDKLVEHLKKQSIPHPSYLNPSLLLSDDNSKAPNILGSLIKNAIFDEAPAAKLSRDWREDDKINAKIYSLELLTNQNSSLECDVKSTLVDNCSSFHGKKLGENIVPPVKIFQNEKKGVENNATTFNLTPNSYSFYRETEYVNNFDCTTLDSGPVISETFNEPTPIFSHPSDPALEEAVNSILY